MRCDAASAGGASAPAAAGIRRVGWCRAAQSAHVWDAPQAAAAAVAAGSAVR
eukprot:COSAG03_NODE_340_length_8832_cov_7.414176_8_plen_52_part_00